MLMKESSLHSAIKEWYAIPGDRFEVNVDNFIVDIMRGNLLVEIQTRNFSAIKKKLESLIKGNRVRLVYPIPRRKWIVQVAVSGNQFISKRRSPRKGRLIDLFYELVRIPSLINEENFTIEVLLIEEEEVRCKDGKGSWRRRGASIRDRRLLTVLESTTFERKEDFLTFLPNGLEEPFSSKNLARSIDISIHLSRKLTYCLRKMGAIREVGKKGKKLLYSVPTSIS